MNRQPSVKRRSQLRFGGLGHGAIKRCARRSGQDKDIRTERTDFGGDTALGVNLEIEEGGGDGGSCGEGKENNEEAAAVGEEESADEAAEHGTILGGEVRHGRASSERTCDELKYFRDPSAP